MEKQIFPRIYYSVFCSAFLLAVVVLIGSTFVLAHTPDTNTIDSAAATQWPGLQRWSWPICLHVEDGRRQSAAAPFRQAPADASSDRRPRPRQWPAIGRQLDPLLRYHESSDTDGRRY